MDLNVENVLCVRTKVKELIQEFIFVDNIQTNHTGVIYYIDKFVVVPKV